MGAIWATNFYGDRCKLIPSLATITYSQTTFPLFGIRAWVWGRPTSGDIPLNDIPLFIPHRKWEEASMQLHPSPPISFTRGVEYEILLIHRSIGGKGEPTCLSDESHYKLVDFNLCFLPCH